MRPAHLQITLWGRRNLVRCLLAIAGVSAFARAEPVYERDIAPIFRTHCAGCHNDADREGDFSLETFSGLHAGGDKGDPLRPGDTGSPLLIRLLEGRSKPRMPPKDEPQPSAKDLATLRQWVDAGAPGPQRDISILEELVVPHFPVTGHRRPPVTAVAFSPDGRQFAAAMGGQVELRRSPEGRTRRKLAGLPGKVNALHFSPDGKRLVAAAGIPGLSGVARIWDLESGQLVRDFGGHRDSLADAEFSPDGRLLATAGYDRTVRLWDAADGRLLRTFSGHNGAVTDLAFDPTGTVLASASADQTVKLWRVADGLRLDTLNQPQGELNAVAFTPDGRQILAAGADKRIYQWDFISTNSPALNPVTASRFAHEAAISAFSISADGQFLLTSAGDHTLKLWSLPDLVERHAYESQPDLVVAMAAGARRGRFAVARMDGSVASYRPRMDDHKQTPAVEAPRRARAGLIVTNEPTATAETEPNDRPREATRRAVPFRITGTIRSPGDADLFRFRARAAEPLWLAVSAADDGSTVDSRIEVLWADGRPVEQIVLQAVRDSWFTFRGKDSETSDDFRLQNWREMRLDEFYYSNGEVNRLWLYPRGPDSGFKVYPGEGRRHTFFGTTALAHALNEPGYIVAPHPAGSRPVPNGLPVFRLNFENDDDPAREAGPDSRLLFTPPKSADYLVRVTDTRGFGGGTNCHYSLTVRPSRPDFTVKVEGLNPKVSPGSGRELRFVARRQEGFEGPIRIDVGHLPAGFTASTPVEIEAGQVAAWATLHAEPGAAAPDSMADQAVTMTAAAEIAGKVRVHELGSLGDIQLAPAPRVTVEILGGEAPSVPGGAAEFTIHPGETITARVRAARHNFPDRIELGGEGAGRNLPHGAYVDNIGLNGLLIVEGETEREFFITADAVTRPGIRRFHLRTNADGGQVSRPAILHVLPARSGTR